MLLIVGILLLLQHAHVQGQMHEDRRCRCQCPGGMYFVQSKMVTVPAIYTRNVVASQCNCEEVVLPVIGQSLGGHQFAFCSRCKCTIQTRNTTLIMGTVISILVVISWLVGFSLFMHCLYAYYTRRLMPREHGEDEQDQVHDEEQPLFMDDPNSIPLRNIRVIMNPLVNFGDHRNSPTHRASPALVPRPPSPSAASVSVSRPPSPASVSVPRSPSPQPSTSSEIPSPRGGVYNMRLRQIPRVNYRKYM